jgi:Cell Wall Hydrolase
MTGNSQSLQVSRRAVLSTAAGGTGVLVFFGADVDLGSGRTSSLGDNDNGWEPPPSAPAGAVANDNQSGTNAASLGRVIYLSSSDVVNLIKAVSTEVVASLRKSALRPQIHGVLDTMLNRLASGAWGANLSSVLNARWQFSLINSSLPGAYGRVENIPTRAVNSKVAKEVVRWLKLRAAGEPSSVGNNLNYLNPYYASRGALSSWGWDVVAQAEKSGMIFGSQRATHFHGTARGLEKARPQPFSIQLEETPDAPDFARSGKEEPRRHGTRTENHAGDPKHDKQVASIKGWGPPILRNLFPMVFK